MQGKDFGLEAFINALKKICVVHLKKWGRLIESDLESYIDGILFIADSMSDSLGYGKLIGLMERN